MTYGSISDQVRESTEFPHISNNLQKMISIEPGGGFLILYKAEHERFKTGKMVVKRSGDSEGHFRIAVKLTRPLKKADRFEGL